MHTFGLKGMVRGPPSVLCPVHGLVVLQLWWGLGVLSKLGDDFCGIVLEGPPALALHHPEGRMYQQADEIQSERELHGASRRRAACLAVAQASVPSLGHVCLFKAPSA